MNKICFSLLTACMLLPFLHCPVQAVEPDELQVYRPCEDYLIEVDGAISEAYWSAADSIPVGSSTLCALCDGYGLYLAFETGADAATFIINGVTVACSLGDTPTINTGTIAGQSGAYEINLGYTALGLKPQNNGSLPPLEFTATIGNDPVNGTLRLCSNGLASDLSFVEPRVLYSMGLAFLQNDDAPIATKSSAYSVNRLVTFDTNHNTLVLDQGKDNPHRFNRIHLFDTDEVSRVSQNDLGVFVSTDGKAGSWTKVTGWQLHQSGSRYTIYNLDETAQYVKVHCYLDALNDKDDPVSFSPSFTNYVSDIMTVEYDPYLLGADSDFAHTGTLAAHNSAGTDLYDQPTKLTLDQIGAKAGEYQESCADFRFTMGDQLLPHWYDGDGSFYVRIPCIPANGSTTISTHWGNPEADDVSDRQATFEAVYGNVSLIDLRTKAGLKNSGRAFTFPNGTVIAVGRNEDNELTAVFSYDGGRTFTSVGMDLIDDNHWGNEAGFGSFIWDPKAGDKDMGRLFVVAYRATEDADRGYDVAECRFVILHTDDYGKTWSDPVVLSDDAKPATDNDSIIENSQGRFYQLSYCDGLTLRDADGDGPNVDYVLSHSYIQPTGTFAGAALFSKDGGKTWIASEGNITMKTTTSNNENGISETALAQLDDGSLYIVARAQAADNVYFYESYSYDDGNTWRQAVPSPVISTNTSPVFLPYGSDRLLMWAGNNTQGDNARLRLPMTLAISSDNYKTYDRSIDLTFGTAFDTLEDSIERMTQPSLSVSPDGNEAFVCWYNYAEGQKRTVGMLIEEFGNMIYKTRGAFDGFECTSLKGEGWLLGDHSTTGSGDSKPTGGKVEITVQQANTGSRSMLLTDNDKNPAYVVRQIPSMRKGTIGVSLYVPSNNATDFAFELKHAYNFTYGEYTMAGFVIDPGGDIYLANDPTKTYVSSVNTNCWNDFAIEFDMVGTKKGSLLVNGNTVSTFDLNIQSDRITAVTLSQRAGVLATWFNSARIYADDFYAVEAAQVEIELPHPVSSTPPAQDGCVFAGWYADAARTVPHTLSTGYAYAKFVDKDVLSVKVQISASTTSDSPKTDLRLLTTVDSVNYRSVGFNVTIGETTRPLGSSKVFKRIVANEGGIPYHRSPNVFSEQSLYFMTYTITGVPNTAFDTNITVEPYWVTLDGTTVTGEAREFTINQVIEAPDSSGLSSSPQGSGDSESFETMFGSTN